MAPEQRRIFEVYKKGQGAKSRLVAGITLAAFIGFGCYALWGALRGYMTSTLAVGSVSVPFSLLIPAALFVVLELLALYILNRPRMADFLINTEGELRKVAWPSRDDVMRQTMVVIATVVVLTIIIFVFDIIFSKVMTQVLPG